MAASIKTIMKMDNSDVEAKLKALNQHFRSTYNDWVDATDELTKVDKKLIAEKQSLTSATDKESKRIKENIAQLQKQKNAIKATQMARRAEVSSAQTAIQTLSNGTKAREKSIDSIEKKKKATDSLTNSVVRHLRQIETLVVSLYALQAGFRNTVGMGLEVNKMMEDNTSGIAALLSANTQMTLSNGEAVDSYQKFAIGQQLATKTMEDLRKASVKTYATFPQLTEIFQQAIGQTLAMGDSFGTTVEEINSNTIKLSQRMSNIAGAIGMPMDRVREEIRSLLSGNASTDSLISTMIFGSPTEANKAIRMAKDRGERGVVDMLNRMLKPFDALENVDTYTRSLLELQDAWSQTMAKMSEPLFEELKVTFKELASTINENQDDIVEYGKTVIETVGQIIKYADDIALAFIAWKTIPKIIQANIVQHQKLARTMELLNARGISANGTTVSLTSSIRRLSKTIKGLARANAPLIALMAAYEGYNYLVSENIEYEERLSKIMDNKVEDINKLTIAQVRYNKLIIEQGLQEDRNRKQEISAQLKKEQYGIFGGAPKENKTTIRLQAELDEINSAISKKRDLLQEYEKIETGKKEQQKTGELLTKLNLVNEANKTAEKYIKTEATALGKAQQKAKVFSDEIIRLEKKRKDLIEKGIYTTESKNVLEKALSIQKSALVKANKEISDLKEKEAEKESKRREKEFNRIRKLAEDQHKYMLKLDEDREKKRLAEVEVRKKEIEASDMIERDKAIALAEIESENTKAILDRRYALGEISDDYYRRMMLAEGKLAERTKFNLTETGQVVQSVSRQMESSFMSFFDATDERFLRTKDLVIDIGNQIYRSIIKQQITSPLTQGLTGLATSAFTGTALPSLNVPTMGYTPLPVMNAKGGAYASASLSTYSNKVVSKPTPFMFANGGVPGENLGVFGEAGAEAIMPLTRTSGGELGVKSIGDSKPTELTINIENNTGNKIEAQDIMRSFTQDGQGRRKEVISIVIDEVENNPQFRSMIASATR